MNPFIAQIMMFGGNFAPRGWAFCHGQLLPIAQNTALFSILGTTYGGDGRTTFALPDMRGRVNVSPGNGPGLSNYAWGQKGGTETNRLNITQMPQHNHHFLVPTSNAAGDESTPGALGATPIYAEEASPGQSLGGASTVNTGSGQPVNNIAPICTLNYIIALVGTFPSRS